MDAERIARIEGQIDTLKVVRPMTITVVSVVLAVLIFVLGFMGIQIASLNAKFDAIPDKIEQEFRTMRADMSAQTSAIANAITATRQQTPQVIFMPASPAKP